MVAAFIRERGVTVCPPRTSEFTYKATASGGETPASFLFREPTTPRTPEQKLAAAKILIHLQDLCGVTTRVEAGQKFRVQHEASRWFFNPPGTTDFELWCETAGFHPDYVREKARSALATGIPRQRAVSTGNSKNAQYQLEWQRRKSAKLRGLQ